MSGNVNDWNARTIAEFRRNHGKVGNFEGVTLLLISHKGARSGKSRVNPVVYVKDGERYIVFATKRGADTNPDWYHNLKANPEVQIEVGDEKINVLAEELKGPERDILWSRLASTNPQFAQYQRQTKRIIPVIAFTPRKTSGK